MKNVCRLLLCLIFTVVLFSCSTNTLQVEGSEYDLVFPELAATWDEGMPLGNSVVGALVWQKENSLRFSLDRIDLWDLRPMDSLAGDRYKFEWVYNQVKKKDYYPVQQKFDWPYDANPAPSKIPGAGLEFPLTSVGNPTNVHLFLNNALCEVSWESGMKMQTFIHANEPVGWFRIENPADDSFVPELLSPSYSDGGIAGNDNSHAGSSLKRLGYRQGDINRNENQITYHQKGWGDFYYDVAVKWEKKGDDIVGVWSVTSSLVKDKALDKVNEALARGIQTDYKSHMDFWDRFWAQSSIDIPDKVLAKQYANEIYKLGSIARENSYPISLQAVWTADNGKLPPWKGDYHHDLNTQLSYWPCYTGNYLQEGLGYLNTMWWQRNVHKEYTRQYFECDGLNVPGVCTLTGEPMGGWIQYSMSPTVGAWIAHHFYLHYKYSGDTEFLKEMGYPYIKEVASFLEEVTYQDKSGVRMLPLSSSPEIFDNSIKAWFETWTNYDLALVRFLFKAAEEMATDLSLTEEAKKWGAIYTQLPYYDLDNKDGLTFAKGYPYNESHRHFSNAMAIHPLGLIDWSNGEQDRDIIRATIKNFEDAGPDYWVGYSYSWFGNLKARAMDGEGAAQELRTFAECFCLRNTFHVNGDQTKSGKSQFTYRPFTLEGNFAFAAGVQEMLIQSHTGVIRIFPAIPGSWDNVSFKDLRTYGAFLVSAEKQNGLMKNITVKSEKGGLLKISHPVKEGKFTVTGNSSPYTMENGVLELGTKKGEVITISF